MRRQHIDELDDRHVVRPTGNRYSLNAAFDWTALAWTAHPRGTTDRPFARPVFTIEQDQKAKVADAQVSWCAAREGMDRQSTGKKMQGLRDISACCGVRDLCHQPCNDESGQAGYDPSKPRRLAQAE